jgi:membrane-associated protein
MLLDLVVNPDLLLNVLDTLPGIIATCGVWAYLILFVLIFCETGLVFAPFLPGDSLLFFLGFAAVGGALDLGLLFVTLSAAAILGDSLNYSIGARWGGRVSSVPFLIPLDDHFRSARRYFNRYGGRTVVISRYIPYIRTFAPFCAGAYGMNYRQFLLYNMAGGVLWVGTFLLGGYLLGNSPAFRNSPELFSLVIAAGIAVVIGLSLAGLLRKKRVRAKSEDPEKARPDSV